MSRRYPVGALELLAVAVGGAAGAGLRAWLGAVVADGRWALTTLGINLAGCVLLALLNAVARQRSVNELFRTGFGTGFCGAFTTFSAIALLFVSMPAWQYASYLLLTVLLCLVVVRGTTVVVNRQPSRPAAR